MKRTVFLFVCGTMLALFLSASVVYAATPSITITDLPTCRTQENLAGRASGVAFANYRVAVYILCGWLVE